MTKVMIGCNEIRDYQFFAPLTGLVWRERIGLEPFLFITGDWQANRRGQVARQALEDLDFPVIGLTPGKRFSTATMAQNVREHAAMMPFFAADDWLMPSDVDLWPIRTDWYKQHENGSDGAVWSYYANGDHYQTLPTCHVTMQAKTWREVYGYPVSTNIEDRIEKTIEEWLPKRRFWKNDENFAIWMSDQAIVTDLVMEKRPDYVKVERHGHPPVDRLCRSTWPAVYDVDKMIDCHLPRPGDQPGNWERVFKLFTELLPRRAEWAFDYHAKYLAGY